MSDHVKNKTDNFVYVHIELIYTPDQQAQNSSRNLMKLTEEAETVSETWRLSVPGPGELDTTPELKKKHTFNLNATFEALTDPNTKLRVMMTNNIGAHVPVQFAYDPSPIDKSVGIIYATIVLLGLYIMIIWEVSLIACFKKCGKIKTIFFSVRLFIEPLLHSLQVLVQ